MSEEIQATSPSDIPPHPFAERIGKLRNAVGIAYDLQKVRIQVGNRSAKQAAPAHLDDADKAFLEKTGEGFEALETQAMKELKRLLKGIPVYEEWLKSVRGVGPAISAILVSEIDIRRAETPSKVFRYCGIAVDAEGHAERPKKGEKLHYNPWLKSKVLHVLAGCLIKAKNPVYKPIYDGAKHRRKHQLVPVCMGCNGTGKRLKVEREVKVAPGTKKPRNDSAKCWNCDGTGANAPWGREDKHREIDARRRMVKAFLGDFWRAWRTIEGLPVRASYAEEYLNRPHHPDPGPSPEFQREAEAIERELLKGGDFAT
jgi:hypothetical protein